MATPQSILDKIKSIKIQGAENVARVAIIAWKSAHDKKAVTKKLLATRPTEPMMHHVLKLLNENKYKPAELLQKIDRDDLRIAEFGEGLIKNGMNVFTHCHSSTVVDVLMEAKARGKIFTVSNTETRPLYQGRHTATDLARLGFKVNHYVDSAAWLALRDANIFLIGADWISPKGVANKIGTAAFAELAAQKRIPIYVCAHSWKFSRQHFKIEQRNPGEVWKDTHKNIHIHNPAFEIAEAKHIAGVVSELGVLSFKEFVRLATWT